jgi:hypothetical protein
MSNNAIRSQEPIVLVDFDYEHFVPGVIAIFQWSDGTETRKAFSSRAMALDCLREIQREGNVKPAGMIAGIAPPSWTR